MGPEATARNALNLVLNQINGKKRGDKELQDLIIGKITDVRGLVHPAIPTGSLALDLALGIGGVPEGRIIEIYGPESSGKTTLALHILRSAQRAGGEIAFIDLEHTLDPSYAQMLGVDIDKMLYSAPESGNVGLRTIDKLVRSGLVKAIAVDSVSALTSENELEGDIDKCHVGEQARLMSQALRILTSLCERSGTTIIFINQIRMKIGVMWGNPETTSGGNALKFYASQRLDIRRGEPIKNGDDVIGAVTKVKVVKNKVAVPFKQALFRIIYGKGIDQESDVIGVAVGFGIIERAGAWYSYEGEKIGQGLEAAIETLKAKPELIAGIREKVMSTFKSGTTYSAKVEEETEEEEANAGKGSRSG